MTIYCKDKLTLKGIIKQVLFLIFVNMAIGLTIASIMDYSFWFSTRAIIMNALYSILVGSSLWKGNEYIYTRISRKYPWTHKPLKTLLWGVFFSATYSFLIFLIINYIWHVFILGRSMSVFWWYFSEITGYIIGSILLMSLISHTVVFYFDWKKSILNEEKLKQEKLALQFETFKNQISPHFLFNSLNVLTSLIYIDSEKAIRFIDQLSDVYRYVLNQKEKLLIPLQEEITFVEKYGFLQKIRFGENLNLEIFLPENFHPLIIPLSIQMLVENAIKHNIVSESKPLTISISNENEYVVVKNNIQKKTTNKTSSKIGIKNIKARYEILTNKSCIIEETQNYFIVKLPLIFDEI